MAARRSAGRRKSTGRKYGAAAQKTVATAMRRRKRGTLRSGPGGKGGQVKSRKQAIAIGLSEARSKGAKVPGRTTSKRTRNGNRSGGRAGRARGGKPASASKGGRHARA